MQKSIDKQSLLQLADHIIGREDQVKIATLSDELTISQVVKFFERQGRSFTKTMIQNYIRVGVLPPPVDKRYYTRNHLILLTLVDNLKAIYSLDEIKAVLEPIRNDPDIFEDDLIATRDVYQDYLEIRKESLDHWKQSLPQLFDHVEQLVRGDGVQETELNRAKAFMTALAIMAETIAMRDLTTEIIREYIQNK